MSVKVMAKVWDADLPPHLKLTLLAYADAAEHDGSEIWPGHQRLEWMTSYSRSQVERNTRDLIKRGVLVRVTRGRKGRRASFQIPLDALDIVSHIATQSDSDSVASEPDSVASEALKGRTDATPPVLDPSLPSVLKTAATPLDKAQANLYWDITVDLFGEPAANQRTLYGRFVAMVQTDWPPGEIRRRAGQLVELWGVKSVTVASLEKHWSRFDAAIGQVSDTDVDMFVAGEVRAATLERLADE